MKAEDNSLLPSNNFEIGIRAGAVFFRIVMCYPWSIECNLVKNEGYYSIRECISGSRLS